MITRTSAHTSAAQSLSARSGLSARWNSTREPTGGSCDAETSCAEGWLKARGRHFHVRRQSTHEWLRNGGLREDGTSEEGGSAESRGRGGEKEGDGELKVDRRLATRIAHECLRETKIERGEGERGGGVGENTNTQVSACACALEYVCICVSKGESLRVCERESRCVYACESEKETRPQEMWEGGRQRRGPASRRVLRSALGRASRRRWSARPHLARSGLRLTKGEIRSCRGSGGSPAAHKIKTNVNH
eukprot:6159457-Pleurochrysis_carterae.AAC.1